MNSFPKLLVLAGLPGAGKSELLRSNRFTRVTGLRVHDFHANAIGNSSLPENSRHFLAVVEALRAGHDCIIADIEFCKEARRDAVVNAIRQAVPEVRVEYHCLRNQPERCRANATRRGRDNLEEEFLKIEAISRNYQIPAGAIEYEVFDPHERVVPERLFEILRRKESEGRWKFPVTEIFNEGWMLRLLLDSLERNPTAGQPLGFLDSSSQWFSEARLSSPFRPQTRRDPLGEGFTHADGVIGHFDFRPETGAGLRLSQNARQFVVIEAKMGSALSRGTKNAPTYNQAARTIACMAKMISDSGIPISELESVGFFVLAPMLELRQKFRGGTNLEGFINADSMRSAISDRIALYETAGRFDEFRALKAWKEEWCDPLVDRLVDGGSPSVLAWKDILASIHNSHPEAGEPLWRFYEQCLKENRLWVSGTERRPRPAHD